MQTMIMQMYIKSIRKNLVSPFQCHKHRSRAKQFPPYNFHLMECHSDEHLHGLSNARHLFTMAWPGSIIFCCSVNWACRMRSCMFYFAFQLLLIYNIKVYPNLPFMCKLHCIAETVLNVKYHQTHVSYYIYPSISVHYLY